MKKTLNTLFITVLLVFTVIPVTKASAQVYGQSCSPYNYSLWYGRRGNDIFRLQNFLISQGYLRQGYATGYFGAITFNSVRQFQAANGLPATGFVGALTRALLYNMSCNVVVPPIPPIPTQAPTISSISPSSGPFGTMVTIYGTNFSRTGNNSINFANVSGIKTGVVSNDGTSLRFIIPISPCRQDSVPTVCPAIAYAPGTYTISVTTPYGTSNSLSFTATDYNSNSSLRPTINGVEGPTTLAINQQGTWTVRATDPNNRTLSYSVDWGDSQTSNAPYTTNAYNSAYTQSASFTHSYTRSGYFTIRFTVRGENGLSVESTLTVYVSGTTNGVPTIYSLSPSTGPFGSVVTVTGTNFDRYNNKVNFAGVNNAYVNIPSYDGTTLQFTPTVTPCASGSYCAQVALNSGDYSVSVTNQYGTSNNLTYHATTGTTNNGSEQTLSLNQTGYFDNNVQVTPVSIVEDSRCPVNVNCIQAGRVVVETRITSYSDVGTYTFSIATDVGVYTLNNGSKIQITNVTPVKYAYQTTPSGEYRITYRVWR